MVEKTAKELLTHGSIEENFLTEYFVGDLTEDGAIPENLAYIGDGIETVDVTQEDKKSSKSYYNGGGQETTTVTGSTRSLAFSGDRSFGDPAQDLIAALADQTGASRNKWFRENNFTIGDSGKLELTESRTGTVTFSDITDKGGNATDPGSFKATASYTSKPTVIKATDEGAAEKLATVLTETPSINAVILGKEAGVKGAPAGE
ncbi:phage tail tube protein [Lacticaseibacillus absianus]|uniref:phage tail tube protein n=1 Tax=Lacticaseibacillus absianus TaxID=2729623 RepID=UPI0015CCA08A|nr:hypothetical protein [Lacticaseibacillus absianus]